MGRAADATGKLTAKQTTATTSTQKLDAGTAASKRNTDRLSASTEKSASSVEKLGKKSEAAGEKVGEMGKSLGKVSALATLIVGGTAKMGMAYDREFSKITGLVGIAAEEVERMKASTLDLAGATAQAPQDLAKAMFTLQSAGLRGADATDSLRVSAELAAGGMGEAGVIAQALTSILDQYGKAGVDAAEAADFLAATARAGNFESSQLAGGLGKVLPIAAQLGISISDVGGSVALLTRANGKATDSITQTAAAMSVMAAPTSQAAKILKDAGLTMGEVRDVATGPGGLVAALRLMQDAAGDTEQFNKLLGSKEAILAANAILGASNEAIAGTFGAVAESAGVAAEVFAAAEATDSFKAEQAMNDLKIAAIDLSTVTAPLVATTLKTVADAVSTAVGGFKDLPAPVQQAGGALLGLTAVAAPALLGISKISKALPLMKASFVTLNPWVVAGGAAIAVAGAAWLKYADQQKQHAQESEIMVAWLIQSGDEALAAAADIGTLITEFAELNRLTGEVVSNELDLNIGPDIGAIFDRFGEGSATATASLVKLGLEFADVTAITNSGTDAFDKSTQFLNYGADMFNKTGDAANRFGYELVTAAEAAGLSDRAILDLLKAIDRTADATDEGREAVEKSTEAQLTAAVAAGDLEAHLLEAALASYDASKANGEYTQAALYLREELTVGNSFIEAQAQAAALAAVATEDLERAQKNLGPVLETVTLSSAEAADATKALELAEIAAAESTRAFVYEMTGQANSFDLARGAGSKYKAFLDGTLGPQQDLDKAVLATIGEFNDLASTFVKIDGSFNEHDDKQVAFISGSRDAAAAVRDETFAMIANGASIEQATDHQSAYETQLRNVLETAGLAGEEVEALIADYLSVPDSHITQLHAETAQALLDVATLTGLTEQYGMLEVEAIAELEAREALRIIGEAVLGVEEFDRLRGIADVTADDTELQTVIGLALEALTALGDTETILQIEASLRYAELTAQLNTLEGQAAIYAFADAGSLGVIDATIKGYGFTAPVAVELVPGSEEAITANIRGFEGDAAVYAYADLNSLTSMESVIKNWGFFAPVQTGLVPGSEAEFKRAISGFEGQAAVYAYADAGSLTSMDSFIKSYGFKVPVGIKLVRLKEFETTLNSFEGDAAVYAYADAGSMSDLRSFISNKGYEARVKARLDENTPWTLQQELDAINGLRVTTTASTQPGTATPGSSYTAPTPYNAPPQYNSGPIYNSQGIDISSFYHDGGAVTKNGPHMPDRALRSDEVPAVLQTGEFVLSREMLADLGQTGGQAQASPSVSMIIAPGAVVINSSGGAVETAHAVGAEMAKFERKIVNTFRGTSR